MPLHLIKMSVGSTSFQSLDAWMKRNSFSHASGKKAFIHGTTMRPKRIDELLAGGSIYWVVKGFIIARNPLLAIDFNEGAQGRARCSLVCGLPMVPVAPRRFRAFQGWRYFKPEDTPSDIRRGDLKKSTLPEDLAGELSDLGLI